MLTPNEVITTASREGIRVKQKVWPNMLWPLQRLGKLSDQKLSDCYVFTLTEETSLQGHRKLFASGLASAETLGVKIGKCVPYYSTVDIAERVEDFVSQLKQTSLCIITDGDRPIGVIAELKTEE